MQQSSDTQLNSMRELRDKLDPSTVEYAAMDRAIKLYEHQEAKIMIHDSLVYQAPKNFYAMFLDELATEQNLRKENNKIYLWWQYAIFTVVGLFVLYLVYDVVTWSPK
jgi:uncharacterized protein YbaP (TraB family)